MFISRRGQAHNWRGGLEAGVNYTPARVPIAGQVFSIITAILVQILLAVCLTRCIANLASWRKIPVALWLLFAVYIDSFMFAFASTVLRFGIGVNESLQTCKAAILICLVFYLSTKILIYTYFVEKAYLVRRARQPRRRTKLYIFNMVCAIGPYMILCLLNIVWRIHYINKHGACVVGMEPIVLWPLVVWEVLVNVYLTALFLGPVRELYSFKNRNRSKLRTMAMRTFVGVCFTLTTSVANLSVLTSLEGEQGWICLLICTSDVFVSVMVLHWVAMSDEERPATKNVSIPAKITNAIAPVSSSSPTFPTRPTPTLQDDSLTPLRDFPWAEPSPFETKISTGPTEGEASDDGFPLDASRIRVRVRHEVLESDAKISDKA